MTIVSIRTIIPHCYIALVKIHSIFQLLWSGEKRWDVLTYNSTAVVLRIALSLTKPRHLVCGCAAFVLPSVRRACLCECVPKCASSKLTLGSCPLKDTVMFSWRCMLTKLWANVLAMHSYFYFIFAYKNIIASLEIPPRVLWWFSTVFFFASYSW